MGITKLFDRGASLHADRPCLIDDQRSSTYREVAARRDRIAAWIAETVPAFGHCAVLSRNSVAAFETVLAVYRANRVYVPLAANNHIDDLAVAIADFDVTCVLYEEALSSTATELAMRFPNVTFHPIGDHLVEMGACLPLEQPVEDVARIVSLYSTGGTTGRPKGVEFTPLHWEVMAANLLAALPLVKPATYLVIPPMTHAAGTIGYCMMATGTTCVILEKFDAGKVIDAIETHQVTHLFLPPTAIYMLLEYPGIETRDFSSLEGFMYAAAPMSTAKLKRCIEVFGDVMIQFWGQTEAPMFCTCLLPEDHDMMRPDFEEARLSSCGRPMLLTRVAVMDDYGNLLSDGERGELVVRGALVMHGYYKNDTATAEAGQYGWHHTGDIGYRDEGGYYYIVDRKKDVIISGGYNIYPSEVEQILLSHPEVLDCAVVGSPDDKWGEAVTAVVELNGPSLVTETDLIGFCKLRLGSIKAPKIIQFWDELPRTPVGKVSKKDIRDTFWTTAGRRI